MLDLTEVFKIVHRAVPTCHDLLNLDSSPRTRGHTFKLRKVQCKLDRRKYFFSHRVVGLLSSLPEKVIDLTILYAFQKRVLKFLRANDVSYFKV